MSEKKNSPDDDSTGQSSSASAEVDFDELFDMFCKVGNRTSEDINLRNVDKWFKQANLFTGDLTTTDTAITFSKIAKSKKKLTKEEFVEMLNDLAQEKKMDNMDLRSRLTAAGKPSFSGITRPIRGSIAADNMERLSNPAFYTGSHKERFDSEGKGLGLAGRYDVAAVDGYVQGYQNKGTFDSSEDMDPTTGPSTPPSPTTDPAVPPSMPSPPNENPKN